MRAGSNKKKKTERIEQILKQTNLLAFLCQRYVWHVVLTFFQPLKGPTDFINAALGRKCSLCDIKILPSLGFFFHCGNLIWLEHCFIQPFPWETRGGIFGLIRGNLQMFANVRVAAGTRGGLALQTIWCWIFIRSGFLGKQGSLGPLTEHIWHAASCVSLRIGLSFTTPISSTSQL